MIIVLSGVETNNKGAELMLYAILQEIERRYPDADVFISKLALKSKGLAYIKSKLALKYKPYSSFKTFAARCRIPGILRRLHLPALFITECSIVAEADYFIDASGFFFSDQFNLTKGHLAFWNKLLRGYKSQNTKIVFLPQAFGPIEKKFTKKIISVLDQYADIIMPREKQSLQYLNQIVNNKEKMHLFTDFTSLVDGVFPKSFDHLKNAIVIIPNLRMIDRGGVSFDKYMNFLQQVIKLCYQNGQKVYLLNHEGFGDEKLCYSCRKKINYEIDVVTNLNALEVKGLIASARLCISSRFHGVASALHSGVPCLATSWSHKYQELFMDYGMKNSILNLDDLYDCISKVKEYLEPDNNEFVRMHLKKRKDDIVRESQEMWNLVWKLQK